MAVFVGSFSTEGEVHRAGDLMRPLRRPEGSRTTVWEDEHGRASLAAATLLEPTRVASDAEVAVVVDGRLDDLETLAARVESPSGRSEAELIRLAYRRWGHECVHHLDGDFAFVVWDGRDGSVFGARDRFGVRPFVYAQQGQHFWVGSQPRLMLAAGVERQPDLWHIAELIVGTFADPETTAFASIKRLPAGHHLLWVDGRLRVASYWSPDTERPMLKESLSQTSERFRVAFDASVARRIAAGGPIGALLSGGVDSSSVVLTAHELATDPFPVFTAVYPELERANERAFAEQVAHQIGTEPQYVSPLELSPVAEADAERLGIDIPLYMPTWPMEYSLLDAARKQGVHALLSGHGGDHVLHAAPLGVFGDWIRAGRWATLAREAQAWSATRRGAAWLVWEAGMKDLLRQRQPSWLRQLRRSSAPALLHPQLVAETHFQDRLASLQPSLSTSRHRLAAFVHHAPTHAGLERMAWVCESLGLSFQTPYWDRTLVELCLSVPRDHLLRDGVERTLIREALANRLPDVIRLRRSKATFDPLLNVGLHRHAQADIQAMLVQPGQLLEWCDMDEVGRIANRFSKASESSRQASTSGEAQALLRILTLWSWLRRTGL